MLNPVRTSLISELFDSESACTIFDGEVDMQVAEAARAILGGSRMRIAAGPAALAEMIAREITPPRIALRSCRESAPAWF
ncbi:MAG: hypothetical protein QOJ99_3748 [Bryobacterales bacterium]|nr:hypothetical protein [Bryobacterales bacterium]